MIPSRERILHNIFYFFGKLTSYSKVFWKGYVTSSSQEGNSLLLSCLIFFCSCVFYDSCLIFPLFASLLNDNSTNSTIKAEVPAHETATQEARFYIQSCTARTSWLLCSAFRKPQLKGTTTMTQF